MLAWRYYQQLHSLTPQKKVIFIIKTMKTSYVTFITVFTEAWTSQIQFPSWHQIFFFIFLHIILSNTHLGLLRALPSRFSEEYVCIFYLRHACNVSTTRHAHHTEKHGSSDVTTLTVPFLTHSMHTVLRRTDRCCHIYCAVSNIFYVHSTVKHGQVLSPHLLCHV